MTYMVDTHPGVLIEDPEIIEVKTLDDQATKTFTPSFVFSFGPHRIAHTMPPQPYVDGTWDDPERDAAIVEYLKTLEV